MLKSIQLRINSHSRRNEFKCLASGNWGSFVNKCRNIEEKAIKKESEKKKKTFEGEHDEYDGP